MLSIFCPQIHSVWRTNSLGWLIVQPSYKEHTKVYDNSNPAKFKAFFYPKKGKIDNRNDTKPKCPESWNVFLLCCVVWTKPNTVHRRKGVVFWVNMCAVRWSELPTGFTLSFSPNHVKPSLSSPSPQNESERLQGQLVSLRSQQSRDAEKHHLLVTSLNEQLKG